MEVSMTTYTVKNIPANIYEKLKRSAELNRRSINSEIIFCIENTVQSQAIDSELVLKRARQLRRITNDIPITDDELKMAKEDGRL
ncbi:MAG: Arc family DNA-binding protein [Anaerolineales bacterium]|nr:Arc family DNA-binding protein [Anaerolineales bacterium]